MKTHELLNDEEIIKKASKLQNWKLDDDHHLNGIFNFKDFSDALDFVVKVGYIAEKMQHHPEINLSWGKVIIKIFTHDMGGITDLDFQFVDKINKIGIN